MVHDEDKEKNNEKDNKKERPKKDYGLLELCVSKVCFSDIKDD